MLEQKRLTVKEQCFCGCLDDVCRETRLKSEPAVVLFLSLDLSAVCGEWFYGESVESGQSHVFVVEKKPPGPALFSLKTFELN